MTNKNVCDTLYINIMHIIILGSGGFRTTPQPNCHCKICTTARRNPQLARSGPSFYIPNLNLLVDTPMESKIQLDRLGHFPQRIIFSHWHPDHTEGYRVIESFPHKPKIFLQRSSMMLKHVPALRHLESTGRCTLLGWPNKLPIEKGHYQLTYLTLTKSIPAYAFLLRGNGKQTLLCPDHAKFLLTFPIIPNLDLIIMNMGTLRRHQPHLTNIKDNLKIIKRFKPKRTIFTHVEESFCITPATQKRLEQKYAHYHIHIAHDFETVML